MVRRGLCAVILCVCFLTGCTSISVAPSCPSELRVGESTTLDANEEGAGAVPTYKWEAVPSDAVTLETPTAAVTKMQALKAGEVVIRLTASDSLYQVTSECRLTISPAGNVVVSLVIDPNPIEAGESAVLFCASTGETAAVTRSLEQLAGPDVTLDFLSEGVATITPEQTGEYTFSCVGAAVDGATSEASVATITVEPPANDNGNTNDNGNANDNGNTNDNRGGRPGRGG